MGFIKEFKEFAMKGSLVDIAVAFVMGGAFGKVISSFTYLKMYLLFIKKIRAHGIIILTLAYGIVNTTS